MQLSASEHTLKIQFSFLEFCSWKENVPKYSKLLLQKASWDFSLPFLVTIANLFHYLLLSSLLMFFPNITYSFNLHVKIIMPKSLWPPLAPPRQSFWQQQPQLWLQHFCHICNFSLSLYDKQRAIHLDKMNKKKKNNTWLIYRKLLT